MEKNIGLFKMLEFKIKNFEEHPNQDEMFKNWRFIVSKEGDDILLHAGVIPDEGKYGHRAVASQYNVDARTILGGGDMVNFMEKFTINGSSGDFGLLPNSVMKTFGEMILKEQGEKYSIDKVVVDMFYDTECRSRPNIKIWEGLGYYYDKEERIITL